MTENGLVRELVGEKHLDLYRNSGTFYHGLNALCDLLPAMVDGLALNANAEGERQRLAMQELLKMKPLPLEISDRWYPR